MIDAVPLGLLAACIVLFVPMGMAGYHLSRNKMLFFSCALFITLAVGVHLMPYIPLVSSFIFPSQVIIIPSPISSYPDSCASLLHNVAYRDARDCNDDGDGPLINCKKSWDWVETGRVAVCEFQKLKKPDASDLLNGSWVVVAGDSQARLMTISLLELVVGPERVEKVRGDLFKRHSDYSMVVEEIGMKLDFIWAPYVRNLTELMSMLKRNNNSPDVMVMGAGLWDMLHVNNASEYGHSLRALKNDLFSLLPVSLNLDSKFESGPKPTDRLLHLFWVGMPTLVTSMLNTDAKRERMTELMCSSYEEELRGSQLLSESGGPLLKLDIRMLSGLCGAKCTVDGMHYDGVVYDAVVQIMLNALLIESDQKP